MLSQHLRRINKILLFLSLLSGSGYAVANDTPDESNTTSQTDDVLLDKRE